ncbi:MAG TPA: N-formylglutamate deformylase [Polyangiales bacterium]|nr:N-formylglutamate deformylase [Polyangiales bacterium]
MSEFLELRRGDAPLIVSFPHTGTDVPSALEPRFASPWIARKDADHWVHLLYDFAQELGATTLRTRLSRSVIDVNRDPSGASLYPGQNTTELCPLATFDGEALYARGQEPTPDEIAERRSAYFDPYHAALRAELERLQSKAPRVVVYDAHSIRSRVPRLFQGELPVLNIGTFDGKSCAAELSNAVERCCALDARFSHVLNGRFRGGWITRHYGAPARGVHAVQMELACRGYLVEPESFTPDNWPPPYAAGRAAGLQTVLRAVLQACLDFARNRSSP